MVLWIKENLNNGTRIITASKPDGINLNSVTIFQLNQSYNLEKKIYVRNSKYKK